MIAPSDSFAQFSENEEPWPHATTNACKLCTPLGACLAFRGVAGAVPFLHGSQGCATYIRRYLISHFREPMDIAASNFSETSAVFGGAANLKAGLRNVVRQYQPTMIGLATTCLSETIGEDVPGHLHELRSENSTTGSTTPPIVSVSTASFRGTHADGFNHAVKSLIEGLVEPITPGQGEEARLKSSSPLALFPGMVSAADLRELKRIVHGFTLPVTVLPDYSETLDGPSWADYEKLPSGGTSIESIRNLNQAAAAIECGRVLARSSHSAGTELAAKVPLALHRLGLPIGLRETDRLCEVLATLSGKEAPQDLAKERGRLIDSWVDGHKYVFGKRAIVYGEEDLVIGLTSLLAEIGVIPVLCASGGRSGVFAKSLLSAVPELTSETVIREGVDFAQITADAVTMKPDLLIGSSKGYSLARQIDVPLVRCGFPVHDRIGGQRILHVGYAGAQLLFDQIVNAFMERKQTTSSIGYSYL